MFGSHLTAPIQQAAKRRERLAGFVAFSLLSLSLLESPATVSAQSTIPYTESAYSANTRVNRQASAIERLPASTIAVGLPDTRSSNTSKSSTRTGSANNPNTTPKPLRLPPATIVDRFETELLPEPSQNSRFTPIQVRTPTWLPAVTSSTKHIEGRRLLDQAHHEYSVAAYASAEASGWNSLRHFAAAIDSAATHSSINQSGESGHLSALESLAIAETAIRESKDFSGPYVSTEPAAIERFIRCHKTKILRPSNSREYATTSAAEAIDRYMNEARIRLRPIAAASVDAAEAMDLLAEVYLGRYESDALPNEISLTLWRAVVQGQPGNPMVASTLGKQLARIGLYEESRWALQHSLSIAADPQTALVLADVTRRTGDIQTADQMQYSIARDFPGALHPSEQRLPDVMQLSPEQFAALSQPVMLQPNYANPSTSFASPVAKSNGINATLASAKLPRRESEAASENQPDGTSVIEPSTDSTPSLFKGFMKRFGGSK